MVSQVDRAAAAVVKEVPQALVALEYQVKDFQAVQVSPTDHHIASVVAAVDIAVLVQLGLVSEGPVVPAHLVL
jgi:hypothetical protein